MAKKVTMEDLAAMIQNGLLELSQQNATTQTMLKEHMQVSSKDHATIHRITSELVTRTEHNLLKARVEILETQAV